jgi:hypothetical protein
VVAGLNLCATIGGSNRVSYVFVLQKITILLVLNNNSYLSCNVRKPPIRRLGAFEFYKYQTTIFGAGKLPAIDMVKLNNVTF